MPPCRDVSGMFNWEKTTRRAQDMLERLHPSTGLGAPRCSFRGAGGGRWGEGGLSLSAQLEIKKKIMDGWMDGCVAVVISVSCIL